jgi:hypothetical protein
MKEAWERQRGGSNASTGFTVGKDPCGAREREPQAAYRLGIDTGEWSGGETPLGGEILQVESTITRGS